MKVVIVGCGWLGQQLGSILADAEYQVFGTCRRSAALTSLPEYIQPVQLDLAAPFDHAPLISVFHQSIVVCAIPPGREAHNGYVTSLTRLSALMQQADSKYCVHLSSTGIYQGLHGPVSEDSELLLSNPRVALLYQGEQILRQQHFCLTLRLAGLIGPGRHPARFTTGKTLTGPEAAANIIHSTDVCHVVRHLLALQPNDILNLCYPIVVTKRQFYSNACLAKRLPPPEFLPQTESGHQVDGRRLIELYHFQYVFADAISAINYCD